MDWTRKWYEKIFIVFAVISFLLCLYFGITLIRGDDSGTEDSGARSNIEQVIGDINSAISELSEQVTELHRIAEDTRGIAKGIDSVVVQIDNAITITDELRIEEQSDRDLITESGIIIDRGQRILQSIGEGPL